jgi:hypothetical protein
MPVVRKALRELRMLFHRHRPEAERVAAERRLRGRDELKILRTADCVVVSFGKSGRTWLRVMLSRFYQVKHGLAEHHLLVFDNLHRKNPAIPKIFFTHDNYLKDYTGNDDSKADYYDKKVVLLVRNSADVAVSQYFQWKFRMRPRKKTINDYPTQSEEVSVYDFVMRPKSGLQKIVAFMNLWAEEAAHIEDLHVVRYEDIRRAPEETLGKLLAFIGTPGRPEELSKAVAFASIENMRNLETKRVFRLGGSRMVPGDRNNPDSYKVRRAKVGGYRDYFDDDEAARIDEMIQERLSPFYGYDASEIRE